MDYRLFVARYISKRVVQLQVVQKMVPTNPAAPPQKIPVNNAVQPFYGCQQNAHKNITVTVSDTERISLV